MIDTRNERAREYRDENQCFHDCDLAGYPNENECEAENECADCTVWDLCVKAAEHDELLAIVKQFLEAVEHCGYCRESTAYDEFLAELVKAGFVEGGTT